MGAFKLIPKAIRGLYCCKRAKLLRRPLQVAPPSVKPLPPEASNHHKKSNFLSLQIGDINNSLSSRQRAHPCFEAPSKCRKGEEARAACSKAMAQELLWLEGQTDAEGPYYLGKQFSAVDCTLLPWFIRLYILKHYRGETGDTPKQCFAKITTRTKSLSIDKDGCIQSLCFFCRI